MERLRRGAGKTGKSERLIMSFISTKEAQKLAELMGIKVSIPTIITWLRKYNLGHQLGRKRGQWVVDSDAFERFLESGWYDVQ